VVNFGGFNSFIRSVEKVVIFSEVLTLLLDFFPTENTFPMCSTSATFILPLQNIKGKSELGVDCGPICS